jgi:hypothetical protein
MPSATIASMIRTTNDLSIFEDHPSANAFGRPTPEGPHRDQGNKYEI